MNMIPPRVMTAAFLLNRSWPIQQINDGTAARIMNAALAELRTSEFVELREFVSNGTFFPKEV